MVSLATQFPQTTKWADRAQQMRPLWRQHRFLRQTCTPKIADEIEVQKEGPHKEKALELESWITRLFTHELYTFEPRPDTETDEQTAFIESESYISVILGGNGSGKTYCGAMKLAHWLYTTAAPRADTPFWIISDSYDQVCGACWKDKLRHILPSNMIDWDRIAWYKQIRDYPLAVPMKRRPWERGNWTLEFRSYEQGREMMQARAIGGAWFSEQYPPEIFEEVLRGLREFKHTEKGLVPASDRGKAVPHARVWSEFTPIDPAKSAHMEDAYEGWISGDEDYNNYEFFHLSTDEALEAGHVDPEWHQAFFSTVSLEMEATRRLGHFGSYKGAIYPHFSPRLHLTDNLILPEGSLIHKRAWDWGAGPDNALVLLWGAKDTAGRWYIYDEYYTTDQVMTWEDHLRAIHEKDGYRLEYVPTETKTADRWKRRRDVPQPRWRYSNPNYRQTYGPPDRPDAKRECAKYQLPVANAKTAVYAGIEHIRYLMKPHHLTQQPLIIVDRKRCPNLARQLKTYRWRAGVSDTSANPADAKPEPLKKNDHAPDALRYLVFTDHVESGETPTGGRRERPKRPGIRHQTAKPGRTRE